MLVTWMNKKSSVEQSELEKYLVSDCKQTIWLTDLLAKKEEAFEKIESHILFQICISDYEEVGLVDGPI